MNLAIYLYHDLNSVRSLPFSLSDVLLVLSIHDIEKPWKYHPQHPYRFSSEKEKHDFRINLLDSYKISLSPVQKNALMYIEGEKDSYHPDKRVMNELATLCHCCDMLSARLWHNHPYAQDEEWGSRESQKDYVED